MQFCLSVGLHTMLKNRSSVHSALMRLIVQDGVVNHAAVVPNHHIAHLPTMAVNKLHVLAMRMQIGQDRFAFGGLNAINVGGVSGADVEGFSARQRMRLHHRVQMALVHVDDLQVALMRDRAVAQCSGHGAIHVMPSRQAF